MTDVTTGRLVTGKWKARLDAKTAEVSSEAKENGSLHVRQDGTADVIELKPRQAGPTIDAGPTIVAARRIPEIEESRPPAAADRPTRSRPVVHAALRSVRTTMILVDVVTSAVVLGLSTQFYPLAAPVVPVLWLAMMLQRSSRADRMAALTDRRPYLKSSAHLALTLTAIAVLFGSMHSTRVVLGLSALLTVVGLTSRTVVRQMAARGVFNGEARETVLVVGTRESVCRTIAEWHDLHSIRVVGACLAKADGDVSQVGDVPVLGSVADVASVARQLGVDIVALHDVDELGGLQLARLQYALEEGGSQLSIITPITNMRVDRGSVRQLGRRVVVDVSYGTPSGLTRRVKTLLDQCLSATLLVLSLPFMLLCAMYIRLTSKGPALFKQTRVGEGGTTFTMYKFRTMRVDAEQQLEALLEKNEVGGGLFKIADDPRVTHAGRLLRRTSLDELPQLLNVLKGEMSLIGPRPALPREVQTYDDLARRRLAVKPGMTGLWQVSGRSNLSWEETVRIDSDYVDNWRPARELSIAMLTIKAVVTRNGAH